MSDRLALAHAFEDSGMPREKAEHVATTVYDAIRGEVARKADLLELEQRMGQRIATFEQRLSERITGVETRVAVLTWMASANLALVVAVLVQLFR
jgi:predicted component of type VI protein secretion system